MLEVNERMPEFQLRNGQREVVTDADFDGAISVIAFFPLAFSGG